MPSSRTHDAVTFILSVPTFLIGYFLTRDITCSAVLTASMLFGGLMFGPDLDLQSAQYTRWGPLRFLWWPYKTFFKHRSRFTHGLIWGTAIRVVYFVAVMTLLLAAALYIRNAYLLHSPQTRGGEFVQAAREVWSFIKSLDRRLLIAGLVGVWWGAASHTLTDLICSVSKQSKKIF